MSCSAGKTRRAADYDVGEKVRLGDFTYNVIEYKWKSQLGDFPTTRVPERNFLLIRLSITNGSGADRLTPTLALVNAAGDEFRESPDGKGVDHWIGVLRKIAAAQTDDGWVLFDVPTNTYRLKIAEIDDNGIENVATVKIPLQLETE